MSSPKSVVSPSGVKIAETGSLTSIFTDKIEVYAGEALWEAGSQAGIIVKSGLGSAFEATASNPWFNEYSDFRADLRLVAKDYSIIPEFRISEHIEDYTKFGLLNKNKFTELIFYTSRLLCAHCAIFYTQHSEIPIC